MADTAPAEPGRVHEADPPCLNAEAVAAGPELRAELADAEVLLGYAAEAGITIPADVVEAILTAQAAVAPGTCTRAQFVAFHTAFTKLASILSPVTAETIRACASEEARRTLMRNRVWAVSLTFVVIILSIVAFVDTSIATKLAGEITDANAAAVKVRTALGPLSSAPANDQCSDIRTLGNHQIRGLDDLTQLQQFAAELRSIYGKAIKLDYFVANIEPNILARDEKLAPGTAPVSLQDRLQLYPGLVNYEAEVVCKIATYEQIRDFAQNILLDNSVALGALAAYVLPIVYALLGAMAFRLRTFVDTMRKRTYHPSYADSARLIAAVIAGAIISLFNGFTQGISISPLAVAFLVGYGVEIFYTFLDTILASFGSGVPRQPASRAAG